MLVLTRKPGEQVTIGDSITVTVLGVSGHQVRIAFEAPHHLRILRGELIRWYEEPASVVGLEAWMGAPKEER